MALFLLVAVLLSATDKLWAEKICCPSHECYDDSPPYDGMPLPKCPKELDMSIKLYTRKNQQNGKDITRKNIPSVYISYVLTVFIVHGWTQSEKSEWMHEMKDAFLAQGDYNVIIVGWKGGSQNTWYLQSVADTRAAGGEIALVSNNIIKSGKSSKDWMYCIGHSLGSHVCGQAGHRGHFGRMTGLDPAGPYFVNRDQSAGLNPSCADLVDVIHTNGPNSTTSGFGMLRTVGHIDFYPNGGTEQPGCVDPLTGMPDLESILSMKNNTKELNAEVALACSHFRAYEFYTESIGTPCFLSHYKCSSPDEIPDSCTESSDAVQSMGFKATSYPARGHFYLETNSAAPFCRG